MRDSAGRKTRVRVTREFLVPLIQHRIDELEKDIDIFVIWCAGRFPEFKSEAMVIRPSEILKGLVKAVLKKGRLGVIYPMKEQLIWAKPEWSSDGIEVYADSILSRTYGDELERLSERLSKKDLDLILLNCAGFDYKMKQQIMKKTGRPVIQTNALTLRVVKELTS